MAAMVLRWKDDFGGTALDESHWTGGHANTSREATIEVDNGLHVRLVEGHEYASAGIVTRDPVLADFDARMRFSVASPGAGTTFELAAITIDPPRQSQLDAALADQFTRSRVYDVHGAPPYVSSEFDEDDGWRIGWNRGSAQTVADAAGKVVSDNHFNRYGDDSGPKPHGAATGWLRLVREGTKWTAFRRDDATGQWLSTGEVLHMNVAGPVYLRLAAKHWVKRRAGVEVAPSNHVQFHTFELHEPPAV
jgi:hypothetical protein